MSTLWPTSAFLIMPRTVFALEKRQLIKRTPGASRSIQLLLGRDQLADLS